MAAHSAMALVSGRIGLVRSLGRADIPVAVAVPAQDPHVPIRYSRYVRQVIEVPNFSAHTEQALNRLEAFGEKLDTPAVAFCNGEADVLLFARHRERLAPYYRIPLAPTELLESLVDKGKFGALAERHNLAVPKTRIPRSRSDCLQHAREIGYPVILKPINQRYWHDESVRHVTHGRKAALFHSEEELERFLDQLPEIYGREIVQQYIAGDDARHFDFHCYVTAEGRLTGWLVAQKLRTYPIHFGMGCYTKLVSEPNIASLCLETLRRIGYTGAANINLKRDTITGQDYVLEINPRFSVWTQFDQACGINLALHQYQDAVGIPVARQSSVVLHQRWLWGGHDLLALGQYRAAGELSAWQWLRSFLMEPGKLEFHVLAWDDPLVLPMQWLLALRRSMRAVAGAILRKIWRRRSARVGTAAQ